MDYIQGLNWGEVPPDLRPGTSCNRSCTSQLKSGTFLLGSTTLRSLYLSIFHYAWCFVKKCSPSRSFCHLSMLGVDRCCRHQTLFKCHKSRIMPWMLENPRSAVGNPTSALGPSGSIFGPSSLAPIGIHHLLQSNLTTDHITLTTPTWGTVSHLKANTSHGQLV